MNHNNFDRNFSRISSIGFKIMDLVLKYGAIIWIVTFVLSLVLLTLGVWGLYELILYLRAARGS